MEKLTELAPLEGESLHIKETKEASRLYQGHHLNSVKGKRFFQKKDFPESTLFINTTQPLGNLAAYLLEPESNDGFLVWNFFDCYLLSQ